MQTQNRVGQQFGNYQLTQLIGSGGYAEVYLAKHVHINNWKYAIKILTGTNLQDEQRNDFLREAQTVSNLQHLSSHIVEIKDFGIQTSGNPAQDGIPYLVMEYAAEGTMRTLYPHDRRVPLDKIVFYMNQVAEALQCAHNQNPPVIHRDIKPENMLLRTRDHLLLSDFGIAITGQATSHIISVKEKDVVGTVTYMAPERLSKHTRRASDQYSLGIVVYEWLSGSPPFDGTEKEIIYQQMAVQPESLSSQYPHITKEIESVVFRALEKDPDNRYPTVQEFARALEQAVQRARQKNQPVQQSAINVQPGLGVQSQQGVATQPKVPSAPTLSQLPTVAPTSPLSPLAQAQALTSDLPTLPSQAPLAPAPPPVQAQPAIKLTPTPPQPSPSPIPTPSWAQTPQSATIPDPQAQLSPFSALPQAQAQGSLPLVLPAPQVPLSSPSPAPQPSPPLLNRPSPASYGSTPSASPSFSQGGPVLSRKARGAGSVQIFSMQPLWNQSSVSFIYGGLFLCLLSAIFIGFLANSALILIGSFIFSALAFLLCICIGWTPLAIFFGVLLALYSLRVGWVAGGFLASWQHLNPSLPPLFLGLIFFIASLTLNIRYVLRRNR